MFIIEVFEASKTRVISTLFINVIFNIIKETNILLAYNTYILVLNELPKLKILKTYIISSIKKLVDLFKKVTKKRIYIYIKKASKAIKFAKIINAYNI